MIGLMDSPASGEGTSAAFPCGAGNKLLAADEPIMIDFVTVMNGYHIDETRFFAIGSMPERAKKACLDAMEIHNQILERAKPGTPLFELFNLLGLNSPSLATLNRIINPL
ncbi:MAG: M24 family metallopeptidase [Syntrophales bacterium]|nr:M24 family metallopeptidase [Syntrophales bacterium]